MEIPSVLVFDPATYFYYLMDEPEKVSQESLEEFLKSVEEGLQQVRKKKPNLAIKHFMGPTTHMCVPRGQVKLGHVRSGQVKWCKHKMAPLNQILTELVT